MKIKKTANKLCSCLLAIFSVTPEGLEPSTH